MSELIEEDIYKEMLLNNPDYYHANKYCNKVRGSLQRGLEFNLSLSEYKRLMARKTCYYTGIRMTQSVAQKQIGTDVTLDRIDSTKGYIKGNVVACCYRANGFKAQWENPQDPEFGFKEALKLMLLVEKHYDGK